MGEEDTSSPTLHSSSPMVLSVRLVSPGSVSCPLCSLRIYLCKFSFSLIYFQQHKCNRLNAETKMRSWLIPLPQALKCKTMPLTKFLLFWNALFMMMCSYVCVYGSSFKIPPRLTHAPEYTPSKGRRQAS